MKLLKTMHAEGGTTVLGNCRLEEGSLALQEEQVGQLVFVAAVGNHLPDVDVDGTFGLIGVVQRH